MGWEWVRVWRDEVGWGGEGRGDVERRERRRGGGGGVEVGRMEQGYGSTWSLNPDTEGGSCANLNARSRLEGSTWK